MHLDCNVSCKIPRAHVGIEEAGCFQTDRETKMKVNDTVPHFNYIKMALPTLQLNTDVSSNT